MAKKTQIDRAIQLIRDEIAIMEAEERVRREGFQAAIDAKSGAIDTLKSMQRAKPVRKPRAVAVPDEKAAS